MLQKAEKEKLLSSISPMMARRTIAILYGTETGNSEEIADELAKMVQRLHFDAVVEEMNAFTLKDLTRFNLLIFVTSTTGQGDMPKNASGLWKSLLRKKLPPTSLSSVLFTTFGLGDSSYPKFNWAARKLHRRLQQLGATEFFKPGEGDERHDDGIDSIFIPWHQDLRAFLLSQCPLPTSVQPIPDETQLPPRIVLRLLSESDGGHSRRCSSLHRSTEHQVQSHPADFPAGDMIPIPDTFVGHAVSNSRVTPGNHWQDVRQLTFKITQGENSIALPNPLPGSTLVVYPKNYPKDVQTLLDLMGWNEIADEPLEWIPYSSLTPTSPTAGNFTDRFSGIAKIHAQKGAILRDLLTHNLDFNSVPKRNFIREIANFATSEKEKERLQELVQSGNTQDLYDYTTRPRRTILELLFDFPSVRIPLERVLDVFPLIRGREFSIANGGASLTATQGAGPDELTVEVLAALVEYRTIIRKPRRGLCSRYLENLPPGTTVRVGIKIAPSGPPCDAASAAGQPLVAVATGTGIAPIRSLIQQRRYHQHQNQHTISTNVTNTTNTVGAAAPSLLFFGCRNEAADFYFRDEWETTPNLRVVPAFSRDRARPEDVGPAQALGREEGGKVYVQHQIRRYARDVAELVGRGAVVCVCGNAGKMPVAVKEALLDALVLGGLVGTREEAEEYWPKVTFWQETW